MDLQNEIKVIENNFDKIKKVLENGENSSLYLVEKINHIITQLQSMKKSIINGEKENGN